MTSPALSITNQIGKVLERMQLDSLTVAETMLDMQPSALIVFSHLRWEFVTQRPQHIMNRLATYQKIIFVEEPIADESLDTQPRTYQVSPMITVVQPRQQGSERQLANWLLSQPEVRNSPPILWFYSAAFITMTSYINSGLIIYDCMDELSAFKGANQVLRAQEKQLMTVADVVFTGGKSLYGAKKKLHHNVHCFPSSVDTKHFATALSSTTLIPPDIASIPGPIVGFYGVIDERLDSALLRDIARKSPQVSFVLLGPVVKISPADLPQEANIHYLGSKKYSELPAYLKAFDITFMPFAMNEATTFISPTKTLEFMAAHKPIISTPIYDVVSDYKHVVSICHTATEIAVAIQSYLMETPTDRTIRIATQQHILANTSWDKTVESMHSIMQRAMASKLQQRSWEGAVEFSSVPTPNTLLTT